MEHGVHEGIEGKENGVERLRKLYMAGGGVGKEVDETSACRGYVYGVRKIVCWGLEKPGGEQMIFSPDAIHGRFNKCTNKAKNQQSAAWLLTARNRRDANRGCAIYESADYQQFRFCRN